MKPVLAGLPIPVVVAIVLLLYYYCVVCVYMRDSGCVMCEGGRGAIEWTFVSDTLVAFQILLYVYIHVHCKISVC